jgi:hypothetical protein
VFSFDKTERYASAMFDAVPPLCMFISYRKGPCHVWRRAPGAPREPGAPRQPPKRTFLSIRLSEDTFRVVDPDHPLELFVTNVPHGPPLAAPRIINVYNVPIMPPVSRSSKLLAKTFQEL